MQDAHLCKRVEHASSGTASDPQTAQQPKGGTALRSWDRLQIPAIAIIVMMIMVISC